MLDELHIANLGVIEDATLTLSPGLTVVTGETGAGKTMVVTALELLLGGRADAGLVRAGATAALVEARYTPAPATAADWGDEDDLLLAREIPAQGRSRARINGRMAPASALQDVIGGLVEVHGQSEQVRLSRPDVQRTLLDRFAGDAHARNLTAYRDAYRRWRDARKALTQLEDRERERAREADRLAFEAAEIEAAEIDLDEDGRIGDLLEVLDHAEELTAALTSAGHVLGSDGAGEPIGVALAALRRVPVSDPGFTSLRDRLESIAAEVGELATDLRDHADTVEADPARLEELRDRRQVLAQLIRKYGADLAEVVAYGADARARLVELEAEQADAATLSERAGLARSEVVAMAQDVHLGRVSAADILVRAVTGHLAELAMPHATFEVAVAPLEGTDPDTDPGFGPEGSDRVTYLLAANPGEPAAPLAQAASGGERSRVALAIEVALADVHGADVLVFDEIDAGIGGATALAVGEKLARLAGGRQVLCVTHLAQLAAFADVHHVVEKGLRDGRTVTTTRRVAQDARAAELSRMLSGDPTRDAALEHARELLDEAAARRAG